MVMDMPPLADQDARMRPMLSQPCRGCWRRLAMLSVIVGAALPRTLWIESSVNLWACRGWTWGGKEPG